MIEIFEPAMCCSTGLCGPSIDLELLRVSTEMDNLAQQGVQVARFNLSANTPEFLSRKEVATQLKKAGVEALPMTLVDGVIAKMGSYPTTEELSQWSGVKLRPELFGISLFGAPQNDAGCCADKNSCDIRCKPGTEKDVKNDCGCGSSECC
jgi:hypothetical protein